MKKSVLPIALVGGLILSGTVGAQYAQAATPASVAGSSLGQKYVWGANDCSGFTQKVFQQFGINLPHNAAAQASYGTYVSQNNLQPGDLVFFSTYAPGITHVGIYVGNNQMISSENEQVGVHETQIFGGGASSYWAPRYVTARRLISSSSNTVQAAVQPAVKSVSTSTQSAAPKAQTTAQQSPAVQTPAAPQAAETPAPAANASSYSIQKGDTLSAISLSVHVSVSDLKAINGLSSDRITAGQTLKLKGQAVQKTNPPAAGSSSTAASSTQAAKTSVSSTPAQPTSKTTTSATAVKTTVSTVKTAPKNSYMVSTGDTLWAISRDHGISIQKIELINHLKSSTIYPGQKLDLQETSVYTIKNNDTLWGIATSHGITVSQLIKTNHLTSTTIYPHQHLVIPQ